MMRILYVGELFKGSTALSRAEALEQLGFHLKLIEGFPPELGVRHLMGGLRRRFGVGIQHPVNSEIMRWAAKFHPDFLWIDKGQNVSPTTLEKARALNPKIKIVYYTPDDCRISTNFPPDMVICLPLFDMVVTTKSHSVEYLRGKGAQRVVLSWQGFDPEHHRPPTEAERDRSLSARVVFVGAFETARGRTIEALLRAGLPVTVISAWSGWADMVKAFPNLEWRRTEYFGSNYARTLASGAIVLGFLRKQAEDQHTSRSFEIPACGGMMLAERTAEHLQLFEEGREAEFFGSDEECIQKCHRLLADPELRTRIAEAGRRRCIEGGYSWSNRMQQILVALDVS